MGCWSVAAGMAGTSVGRKAEQGQLVVIGVTLTEIAFAAGGLPGVSMLPLSSKPRDSITTVPAVAGTQLSVQLEAPLATCQVVPPSTETSTPATVPPTSEALPLIVTDVATTIEATFEGEAIEEL